jgi:6-phosphogluconolactonase
MLALGSAGSPLASRHSPLVRRADEELLYVGTYTDNGDIAEGIHLVQFDTRTGALTRLGAINAGANPSFLTIHPKGHALYAVNEVTTRAGKPAGGVSAFSINRENGQLSLLNEQSSEGGAPCYISPDRGGRSVLVANYVGGNVAVLPVMSDGSLGPASHVVQHAGRGPNAQRQEAPHAHFVATDPSNRFALAADLGVDRVLVYRLSADGRSLQHESTGDGRVKPGAGPRHVGFHPTLPFVVVANELDSTVTAFRFHSDIGALTPVHSASTLPASWRGTSYCADIHFAPSGRYVYVSNRGHNSIAMLSVAETGALRLEQTIATGGDWPRNFSLDPTGDWLLVANQRSGDIVVFSRDEASGRLSATPNRLAVARPVCLRFRSHTGVTA